MIRTLMMGMILGTAAVNAFAADAPKPQRVFELRTYTTNEGKLEDLHKRFREHTNKLFVKHGMELVGYWTPQDEKDGKKDKLVYILAYPSREAAAASWKAFGSDPEWQKVREESHKNGVIVKHVDSVFLDPTDYSPIK
ncbi:NIPSNAP family protein [Singulisphaera sp. PoT]|uniref:NIPSNAP family protein n=1 Tax=Singulisphaera sp. PoT TaxID=3411797 RepID=UPI003BF61DEC